MKSFPGFNGTEMRSIALFSFGLLDACASTSSRRINRLNLARLARQGFAPTNMIVSQNEGTPYRPPNTTVRIIGTLYLVSIKLSAPSTLTRCL